MSDEELINALRSINHMNVDDCFLQSHFYSKAADRIKELAAQLKMVLEREAETQRRHEAREDTAEAKLAIAEAKLARIEHRVDHITLDDAGQYLPEHRLDVWVLALNTAHRIVMEELEETE